MASPNPYGIPIQVAFNVAPAGEQIFVAALAGNFAYVSSILAICSNNGSTGGAFQIRSSVAGVTLITLPQAFQSSIQGNSQVPFTFDVPLRSIQGGALTVQPTLVTQGSWQFIVNGWYSGV